MLKISNVETFYGKIQALRGVNIDIKEGEIVSLIGSNGAGKSTLLMTISGVNKAKRGEIVFEGKNIEKYEPHTIVDLGIAQAPEGRRIFSRLTVEENLKLGAHANEKGKHFNTDIKEVYDLFPVLSDRKSQRGGTLSGGEQQMLAIGRALMNRPKVLLLDEPSLGIAPKLVNQIFLAIKNINKEKKVTIFLVEQNAKKALELADRAYVLVNGKVTIEGTGKELLINQIEFPHTGVFNNHIINNARAIIWAAMIFSREDLGRFAQDIACYAHKNLFDENGCLNEASFHYQLIVTKRLREISIIAKEFFEFDRMRVLNVPAWRPGDGGFDPLCLIGGAPPKGS